MQHCQGENSKLTWHDTGDCLKALKLLQTWTLEESWKGDVVEKSRGPAR